MSGPGGRSYRARCREWTLTAASPPDPLPPASSPRAGELKSTKLVRFLNQFYNGKKCAEAVKMDASTDFGKMRVGQLKQLLEARGESCKECFEKADYIRRVKEAYGLPAE